MSAKAQKKKPSKPQDLQATGMWIDAALIAKLYGRTKTLSTTYETRDAETLRVLHYADLVFGTDKKEKFVSTKPTKDRIKL